MAASSVSSRALDSRCSASLARVEDSQFDRLYHEVEKTLKTFAPDAKEASDEVVLRQICKSLRKGAKSSVFEQKPLHENVWQFCNKAFESLFAGMSNHKTLHRIDFIYAMDIAIKESFPTDYLLRAGLDEYQSELEWACDAAFETQRFEYITWDILPQFFCEKKKWKKISTILDQARLKALLHNDLPFGERCSCWVEKYTSTWMNYVVSEWKALAKNYTLNAPTKVEVVAVFYEVLQAGGLPQEMERSCGLPSKAFIEQVAGWILDDQEVPDQGPRQLKSEVPVRQEGGGLRQRARGRNEGYGKGYGKGADPPILARTVGSLPPARSAPRMFPSRSPSLSPRRDAHRRHYGVEDAAEMPESRREERHPASPASDVDSHSAPTRRSHDGLRHHELAAGVRISRMKEELPDQLEESADEGGDDLADGNAGDLGGSRSSHYGKVGHGPMLVMKEELQEHQEHRNDLENSQVDASTNSSAHTTCESRWNLQSTGNNLDQDHHHGVGNAQAHVSGQSSTGKTSNSHWSNGTPGHEGDEDASKSNWNGGSSTELWDGSAWSGAWAEQHKEEKEKSDSKSWGGWNMQDWDTSWKGEPAEDLDQQGDAKKRRVDS